MFTEQTLFHLKRIAGHIWVRPAVYVLGTLFAVLLGPFLDPLVPAEVYGMLQEGALKDILTILASSMLSVAIFSLGTMVAAYQVGASAATPRARPLLARDRTAQNAISTFIGAFLFSLLGLTGISIGLFSQGGRFIMFILSVALIAWVLATFIRWMQRLTNLGGVTEVMLQVEAATTKAFTEFAKNQNLGAVPIEALPGSGAQLMADNFGHIQHIDSGQLKAIVEESGVALTICVRPGAWVHPARPLVISHKTLDEDLAQRVRATFVIGDQRTFEKDPRYGLVVMSEIAIRALSPAVNDPGTAIVAIHATTKVLAKWQEQKTKVKQADSIAKLQILELDMNGLLEDAYTSLANCGADHLQIAIELQRSLSLLMHVGEPALQKAAEKLRDQFINIAHENDIPERDRARLLDEGRRLYPLDASL